MRKKAAIALGILSAVILVFGVCNAIASLTALSPADSAFSLDATDFTKVAHVFSYFLSMILFFAVMGYYLGSILILWVTYGIVLLILWGIRKIRRNQASK